LKEQLVAEQWAEAEKVEAEIEASTSYEHLIVYIVVVRTLSRMGRARPR
jgi:hypothetical protein